MQCMPRLTADKTILNTRSSQKVLALVNKNTVFSTCHTFYSTLPTSNVIREIAMTFTFLSSFHILFGEERVLPFISSADLNRRKSAGVTSGL